MRRQAVGWAIVLIGLPALTAVLRAIGSVELPPPMVPLTSWTTACAVTVDDWLANVAVEVISLRVASVG